MHNLFPKSLGLDLTPRLLSVKLVKLLQFQLRVKLRKEKVTKMCHLCGAWSSWSARNKSSKAWERQIPWQAKASAGLTCSHSMHSHHSPPPQCVQAFTIFSILLHHRRSHCIHSHLLKCCRAQCGICSFGGTGITRNYRVTKIPLWVT